MKILCKMTDFHILYYVLLTPTLLQYSMIFSAPTSEQPGISLQYAHRHQDCEPRVFPNKLIMFIVLDKWPIPNAYSYNIQEDLVSIDLKSCFLA